MSLLTTIKYVLGINSKDLNDLAKEEGQALSSTYNRIKYGNPSMEFLKSVAKESGMELTFHDPKTGKNYEI